MRIVASETSWLVDDCEKIWYPIYLGEHCSITIHCRTINQPALQGTFQVLNIAHVRAPISMDWFKGKSAGNHRFSHYFYGVFL
jgi:hypothetical protein